MVEQRELARRHYERVRAELGSADQTDWSAEQRAARRELLVTLDDYARRADFGVQRDVRAPRPIFVDEEGRRCAVAELLHATGEDELVAAVASANNHAWI